MAQAGVQPCDRSKDEHAWRPPLGGGVGPLGQMRMSRPAETARLAVQETQAQKVIASQFHEQEHEIAEARAIQEGFLPKEISQLAGYEIASAWQSARVVGGDYFDVLPFGGESCGLCIADVAG